MADETPKSGDMASALDAAMSGTSGSGGSAPASTPSAPASAPSRTDAAVSPPASAPAPTSPGAAPTQPPAEPDLKTEFPNGLIPFDRHKSILETTRQKQLESARQQIYEEFGPWNELRKHFTPQEFQGVLGHLHNLSKNPVQFVRDMAHELGFQLVVPGQPFQPQQRQPLQNLQPQMSPEPPGPDMQFRGDDGQLYPFHSPQRLMEREQWFARKLQAEMQQMVRPILETQQQGRNQQLLSQIDQQARAEVDYASKHWDGFNDPDMRTQMHALMQADKRISLPLAYIRAYNELYLPRRDQQVIQSHDQSLAQKARAAGTPISPSTRPGAAPASQNGHLSGKSTFQAFREGLAQFWPHSA